MNTKTKFWDRQLEDDKRTEWRESRVRRYEAQVKMGDGSWKTLWEVWGCEAAQPLWRARDKNRNIKYVWRLLVDGKTVMGPKS